MAQAPASNPVSPEGKHESVSVSTRKIDNGYIVSRSRSTDDSYECSETYSATKPNLEVGGAKRAAPEAPSALRQAIDSIAKE